MLTGVFRLTCLPGFEIAFESAYCETEFDASCDWSEVWPCSKVGDELCSPQPQPGSLAFEP